VRRALFLCVLLVSLTAAHAAAPPPQWLPQESWPGGRQYDPRLERTVKFWGTGVPAADLFASVTKQTGVALSFDPPDDDNARICLNVYLNPEEPPTLREMLVQIGWVMDCAWAVEGAGEQSRYVLLHTSIGKGWFDRLNGDFEREWQARDRREAQAAGEMRAKVVAALRELAPDLDLRRDEAVRKYRGTGNLKLLIVLDPARRALARLFLTFSERLDEFARPNALGALELDWSVLTPEQRGLAREALRPAVEDRLRQQREGRIFDEDWADWAAIEALGLTLHLTLADRHGAFYAGVVYEVTNPGGGREQRDIEMPSLQLVSDSRLDDSLTIAGDSDVALRRLLGEQISEEEARRAREQQYHARQDQALRERAERELASLPNLSAENTALLSALHPPLQADRRYALWPLQEAVAAGSGLHVISDCFFQPGELLSRRLELLYPGERPDLSALLVLRAMSVAWGTPAGLTQQFGTPPQSGMEGWEWGDAGAFLHFRSRSRDVWRAALLPQQALGVLASWLTPALPHAIPAEGSLPEVKLALDLHEMSVLLVGLTLEQRQWGGLICYGDPSDPVQQYARVLREGVLAAGTRQSWHYPFFARLTPEQCRQLDGEGLTWGVDISLSDTPESYRRWWSNNVKRGDVVRLDRVESDEADSSTAPAGPSADYAATIWSHFWHMRPDGTGGTGAAIPRNLVLRPQRLPHLVPPPPEYAP
jgi:hypothetical protein